MKTAQVLRKHMRYITIEFDVLTCKSCKSREVMGDITEKFDVHAWKQNKYRESICGILL
ncbi:hypothetical protein EHE19_014540 [Ruminiclostridium herbifermentans]|uniref:Uncharacterized protein n=1 Tax=Ruminiclostridium herbifermentans TaxID=2488810 RepID=A0A7H1VL27_9FIRM|nr:hypothetical protein [Ruminiclostridium herbifermentans]QNU66089.1 hypothetical protein EHE19_014540 [Ruminiclostridium herbifermentans]